MREQRTTHAFSIIMAAIGAIEFDEMFSESDNEEVFSGFEADNSDPDLDFIDISSVSSDESDVEDEPSEAPREEQIWTEVHSDFQIEPFVSPVGPNFEAFVNAKEIDYFRLLGDEILNNIVEESNRFARQKLVAKPDKLERWVNITLPELKAYLGIAIIIGMNYNPRIAMYWSADEFYCNPGIKKDMPRNRFDEIKRFLHFSDSSKQVQRGEESYIRPPLQR